MGISAIGKASQSSISVKQTNVTGITKPVEGVKAISPGHNNQVANRLSEETEYSKNMEMQEREAAKEERSPESMRRAVESLNSKLSHSEAIFGIHDKTNRVTIKIVDKNTKEILRELPPEKTLDMIAKVWELAGMLVDEKR